MKNQVFTGTPTSPRFALCPSTVKAGDMVLIGKEPACALQACRVKARCLSRRCAHYARQLWRNYGEAREQTRHERRTKADC